MTTCPTFTQSDQSSLCAQWVAKDSRFLHANSLIRLGGCQADLSLPWAYRSLYWFCHAQAQMKVMSVLNIDSFPYRRVRLTFGVSPIASETFYQIICYLHYSDGSDQQAHPHISNQSLCCPPKLLILVYPQCVQQRLVKPTVRECSLFWDFSSCTCHVLKS